MIIAVSMSFDDYLDPGYLITWLPGYLITWLPGCLLTYCSIGGGVATQKNRTLPQISNLGLVFFRFFWFFFRFFFGFFSVFPF